MSKGLKTAAMLVGAVALVATGIGSAAGAGLFGAAAQASVAAGVGAFSTIATIGTVASIAAGVLSLGAALTAKKPSATVTGSQTSFSASPDDGLPLILGRAASIGRVRWAVAS